MLRNKASYIDIAVILGVIHGYADDGFYGYTNAEVLSSAVRIATAFIDVFPIANKDVRPRQGAGHPNRPLPRGRLQRHRQRPPTAATPGTSAPPPWRSSCTPPRAPTPAPARSPSPRPRKPFFDYFAPAAALQPGRTYAYKQQAVPPGRQQPQRLGRRLHAHGQVLHAG